jgi:hypothetical protein
MAKFLLTDEAPDVAPVGAAGEVVAGVGAAVSDCVGSRAIARIALRYAQQRPSTIVTNTAL